MTTPTTAPAGWYADPHQPEALRYFDGSAWTEHVSATPAAAPAVPSQPAFGLAYQPTSRPATGSSPSDPVHWLVPTGRTWQSIAAGYVALFAIFLWPLGPVALGLGVWAMRVSSAGGAHGRGRAIFAIVVGAFATLALCLVLLAAV